MLLTNFENLSLALYLKLGMAINVYLDEIKNNIQANIIKKTPKML